MLDWKRFACNLLNKPTTLATLRAHPKEEFDSNSDTIIDFYILLFHYINCNWIRNQIQFIIGYLSIIKLLELELVLKTEREKKIEIGINFHQLQHTGTNTYVKPFLMVFGVVSFSTACGITLRIQLHFYMYLYILHNSKDRQFKIAG